MGTSVLWAKIGHLEGSNCLPHQKWYVIQSHPKLQNPESKCRLSSRTDAFPVFHCTHSNQGNANIQCNTGTWISLTAPLHYQRCLLLLHLYYLFSLFLFLKPLPQISQQEENVTCLLCEPSLQHWFGAGLLLCLYRSGSGVFNFAFSLSFLLIALGFPIGFSILSSICFCTPFLIYSSILWNPYCPEWVTLCSPCGMIIKTIQAHSGSLIWVGQSSRLCGTVALLRERF